MIKSLVGVFREIVTGERFRQNECGRCRRCKKRWFESEPHVTMVNRYQGYFAICEKCWQELGTFGKRLPYYRMLVDEWNRSGVPCGSSYKKSLMKALAKESCEDYLKKLDKEKEEMVASLFS